jgi:hypothetical protein
MSVIEMDLFGPILMIAGSGFEIATTIVGNEGRWRK